MKQSRWFLRACGAVLGLAALASTAAAEPEIAVEGEVVASVARWARGGADLVTESVVLGPAGRVTVRQLGGSRDGIGMRVLHAPPLLAVGDRVRLTATTARDRRGRPALVVRRVEDLVRAAPPTEVAPAAAFVRTTNSTGAALYWEANCAFIAYATGGTSHLAGDSELAAMDAVLARWRADTDGCSYLQFELEGEVDAEVGLDGTNLIKFREDRWCRPPTDDEPEECYDSSAAGLTTLYFVDDTDSDANGRIFDADIELNGIDFAISLDGVSTRPDGCKSDLANTLTHEIGHLLGLDHTCWNGTGPQPHDADGALVARCDGNLSTAAREATMFAFQDCGETKKVSPEADDVAAVCAIYPLATDPGECSRPSLDRGGCCAVAGARAPSPATWLSAATALGLLAALRRRRRAATGRACSRSRRP